MVDQADSILWGWGWVVDRHAGVGARLRGSGLGQHIVRLVFTMLGVATAVLGGLAVVLGQICAGVASVPVAPDRRSAPD
jgi:hypothetical protein